MLCRYLAWREWYLLASWAYLAAYLHLVMPINFAIPEVVLRLHTVNFFAMVTGVMCLSWLALHYRVSRRARDADVVRAKL